MCMDLLFSLAESRLFKSLLDLQMLLNTGRYLQLATGFSTKWRSRALRAPDSVAVSAKMAAAAQIRRIQVSKIPTKFQIVYLASSLLPQF